MTFNLFSMMDDMVQNETQNNKKETVLAPTEQAPINESVANTNEIVETAVSTENVEVIEEVTAPISEQAQTVEPKGEEVCTNDPASEVGLSLLDNAEEVEQEQKLEEAAKEVKASTASKGEVKAKVSEKDEFAPKADTVIRYYGETIALTEYATLEEIAEGKLTAEKLRKRLEKDYPELVASHTELVFLDKKEGSYIVPTLKAKKKGLSTFGGNQTLTSNHNVAKQKLPRELLHEFVAISHKYAKHSLEIHADIYYCPIQCRFFLDVPEQRVNKNFCEVTESARSILERVGYSSFKVAEIHSHHFYNAQPSPTDNASERVPGMVYIIVGNLDHFYPTVYCRKFIDDKNGWEVLEPQSVFTAHGPIQGNYNFSDVKEV